MNLALAAAIVCASTTLYALIDRRVERRRKEQIARAARRVACPLCRGRLQEWDRRYTPSHYDSNVYYMGGRLGGVYLRCEGCGREVRLQAYPDVDGFEVRPSTTWVLIHRYGERGPWVGELLIQEEKLRRRYPGGGAVGPQPHESNGPDSPTAAAPGP